MAFPRPASDVWDEWLSVLTPVQLQTVDAWKQHGYNEMLSPKTCWYLLCGRFIPAERRRREAMSEEHLTRQAQESAARRARLCQLL